MSGQQPITLGYGLGWEGILALNWNALLTGLTTVRVGGVAPSIYGNGSNTVLPLSNPATGVDLITGANPQPNSAVPSLWLPSAPSPTSSWAGWDALTGTSTTSPLVGNLSGTTLTPVGEFAIARNIRPF